MNAVNTLAWRIASMPGRLDEAIELLGEALEAADLAGVGPDERMYPYMRANRGHLMMRAGDVEGGVRELVEGHSGLLRILGPDNRRVRGVARVLADFYERRGERDKAAVYRD